MSSTSSTCEHIQAEFSKPPGESIIPKYKTVLTWNINRSQAIRTSAKRRRIAAPSCGSCNLALSRPWACLHCDFAGCWDKGHARNHPRDTRHLFCADAKTGAVFCSECDDIIYDATLDEICVSTLVAAEEKNTKFQVSGKSRDPFKRWNGDKDAMDVDDFVPIVCQARRGLVNLGQTCFLNAVLQCLVHNPLLRNYFLGDKHNWKQCRTENCTCCELDKLFTEIYSDNTTPFSPTTFLYTLWKASSELSGYAQQDAHEFFMATLNHIHSTSRGSTNVSCNCIIHNTFAGQLQSDVRCERCGNTTTTIDPTLDISLELKGSHGENTLAACLRRFTQPEKLGAKEYSCSKCNSKGASEANKRLSIRTLPPVLSFQFKRFEQKSGDKSTARKLDTPVRIPGSINMAPYTSRVAQEMEKENSHSGSSSSVGAGVPFSYHGPEGIYEYDLFAVINHEGQIDNGHYTNFARFEDEWYRFDDDKVTHSSLTQCLNSNPYMCFYVKRHIEYKAYVTPSYVLTRETEAQKEKEREKVKEREKEQEKEKEKEKERMKEREIDDALLATV